MSKIARRIQPRLDEVEDIATLETTDEDQVFECIKQRFNKHAYYTYIGDAIIAVNPCQELPIYSKKEHEIYTNIRNKSCQPSHIFWAADFAHRALQGREGQCLVVTGDSGAGKTESTKLILNHLVHLDGKSTINLDLVKKLEKINLVLEFFGNAETCLNENSSRFGKLIEISYNDDNKIEFAKIEGYILEKFRVTEQNQDEKNFHAFYALFAGMSDQELSQLQLEEPSDYRILTTFKDGSEQRKYEQKFAQMVRLFREIGLDKKTVDQIYRTLSAILHLTNVEFDEDPDGAAGIANEKSDEHVNSFCTMLALDGQDVDDMKRFLTMSEVRGEYKIKTLVQAEDGRDSLARELYSCVFYGIIDVINTLLAKGNKTKRQKMIRILDVSGFENIPNNNSFEQLLINTVNENLHQYFLKRVFKEEQDDFIKEGINPEDIGFKDNTDTLGLLYESPGSIFSILNDSMTLHPKPANFLLNLEDAHPNIVPRAQDRRGQLVFVVQHYAADVWYNAEKFLTKNRDTVSSSLSEIVLNSDNMFVDKYFQLGSFATTSKSRGGRSSFRRDSLSSSTSSIGKTGKLMGRVTDTFRKSLKRMLEKIQTLQPVFIKCIKPNNKLLPGRFDAQLVRRQLQNSGIMDMANVRSKGYPIRIPFMDFYKRYKILLMGEPFRYPKEASQRILQNVEIFNYQIGKTKMFLKTDHRDQLEAKLIAKEEEVNERKRKKSLEAAATSFKSPLPQQIQGTSKDSSKESLGESSDSGRSTASSGYKVSALPPYISEINETNLPSLDEEIPVDDNPEDKKDAEKLDDATDEGESKKKKKAADDKSKREAWEAMCISERDCENSNEFEISVRKMVRLVMYFVLMLLVLSFSCISKLSLIWISYGVYEIKTGEDRNIMFIKLIWCLAMPMILKWFSCLFKALFSNTQYPSKKAIVLLTSVDVFQTGSKCAFVILLMPFASPLEITLCGLSVCQIPTLFNIIKEFTSRPRREVNISGPEISKPRFWVTLMLSVLAFMVQVGSPIVLLTAGNFSKLPTTGDFSKLRVGSVIVLACFFVSIGYWENYAFGKLPFCNVDLSAVRKNLRRVRMSSYIYSAPVQIAICGALCHYLLESKIEESFLFYWNSFTGMFFDTDKIIRHFSTFGLMYIQMASTYLCAYCSGLTCRLHMQRFGFALPILLVPIVTTVLASLCTPTGVNHGFDWIKNLDMCKRMTFPTDREGWITLGLCIAVYFSYVFVTRHIWYPKLERMAKIERLFSFGHSDPVYSDVSLALKRRQDLAEKEEYKKKIKEMKNPMVYICATMWHEIRQEMIQLCKSLFRLDFDICQRYLANKNFGAHIDDLYSAEVHVIFDDAFQTDEKTKQRVVNSYVEQLIEIMPQACSSVSKGSVTLDPVKKITTPYGGRLEWIMPGGTKMEVHLKDKNKIRHKKRWSQIMYMYYLLGHKLLKGYSSADELLREDKRKVNITAPVRPHSSLLNRLPHSVVEEAANTFVMALDGDVDFGPESVRLLIDRMKKNRDVAAVCGRIHPIGQGPMVWYQQFEYSVGHWLQKATENVLGCVLCCPGCFSLFRGSSLMDDNVMRLYAIEPTEAKHYIQYEQGEDRWLCTLLLQQGYKIDYCAGSDAFTYAPETFHDFYIQRRRWSPSTMANVMDLLTSWKTTVKMNNNISTLFMLYQFILMASSILAPGTVTFMISGSYTAVLGLNPWQSYLLSTLPVLAYVLLCLKAKTETQVAVAAIMSAVYSIVMVIVSIGTVINIVEEDFLTPNVLFLIGLSTIFVITAFAHPNELMCLVHGILYYLTVPSTFVFLTVFFLCNLNIVSWGTREAPKKVDPEDEVAVQQATAKKGKLRKFIESLGISSVLEDLRSFIKQTLGRENEKPSPSTPLSRDLESGMSTPATGLPLSKPKPKVAPRKPKEKVVVIDPDFWKGATSLEDGTDGELEEQELLFWGKLITKFLLPLKENKEKQEQIAADLISIRNNVVFAYMLLNVMFTLVILQLQLKQDILEEKFFIAGKYEPVSVIFLGVFSVLILTQFFSMLVHRWGTFLLLISSTDITYCTNEGSDSTAMALKQIEEMQTGQKDILYPDGSSEYSGPKDLGDCMIESDEEEEEEHDPRSKFEKIVEREHNRRKSIIAITAAELPQTRLNSWVAQTRRDTKTMAVRNLYNQTNSQNYRQQDYYQPNGYGNTSGFSNKNDVQRRYQQNPQISRLNPRRSRRESVFAADFDDIPECDYD